MKPFDPVEYMCSEEGISAFLNEAEKSLGSNSELLVHFLEAAAKARSINQLAEATGIDRRKIYEMFSGSKADPTIIAKVKAVFVSSSQEKALAL